MLSLIFRTMVKYSDLVEEMTSSLFTLKGTSVTGTSKSGSVDSTLNLMQMLCRAQHTLIILAAFSGV